MSSNFFAYELWLEALVDDQRFVEVKESSGDIRRTSEIISRLCTRYDLFTGIDKLVFEALTAGAIGCVAGLMVAFPHETEAIYKMVQAGRYAEALAIIVGSVHCWTWMFLLTWINLNSAKLG